MPLIRWPEWIEKRLAQRRSRRLPPPPYTDPLARRLDSLMRCLHAFQPYQDSPQFVPDSWSGTERGAGTDVAWAWVELGPYKVYWATAVHDEYWPFRLGVAVAHLPVSDHSDGHGELLVWIEGEFQAPGPWQIQLSILADRLERLVIAGEQAYQAYLAERTQRRHDEQAARWEQARARAATWSPVPAETLTSKEG